MACILRSFSSSGRRTDKFDEVFRVLCIGNVKLVQCNRRPKLEMLRAAHTSRTFCNIKGCGEASKRFVLILPWLRAPASALKKYEELYARHGFQPIVYQAGLTDFLLPKSGLRTSVGILELLQEKILENGQDTKFVIHSASVGCYFYALMLLQMKRDATAYSSVKDAIVAQVCDSPVVGTLHEMAFGVGKMLSPKSKIIAAICQKMCLIYLNASQETVMLYDELITTFKHHAPLVPSVICSSEDDPMRIPVAYEDLCDSWKKKSLLIENLWKESSHAQHLRYHPKEYEQMIAELLSHVETNKQ